jgi:hypothetical protein
MRKGGLLKSALSFCLDPFFGIPVSGFHLGTPDDAVENRLNFNLNYETIN